MSISWRSGLVLALLNVVILANLSASARAKCNLERYKGVWVGNFEFDEGDAGYLISIEISSVKKCSLEGIIHYPDYFNSKIKFGGSVQNDTLILKETRMVQGINMDRSGEYRIPLLQEGNVLGYSFNSDNILVGTFELTAKEDLTTNESEIWESKIDQSTAKFGVTQILEDPVKEKIEDVVASQSANNLNMNKQYSTLQVDGYATFNEFKMALYGAFEQPNKSYLRMEFQSVGLIQAKNGVISWEFNPFSDEVKLDSIDITENKSNNGFVQDNLASMMDSTGYSFLGIEYAKVDSIDAFRLTVLNPKEEEEVIYLDKRNYQVVRKDVGAEAKYFFNYREFDGILLPTTVHQVQPKQVVSITVDKFTIDAPLEKELFDLPSNLLNKIKKPEKDADYYNELGNEKFNNEDYAGAAEAYSNAILQDPRNATYFYNRGAAKNQVGDFYGAISDFNQSLSLVPDNKDAYNRMGLSKYYLEDFKNAVADFSRAINLDSTDINARSNRAYAYLQLENYTEAERDFQGAINLDSTNANFHYNHGLTFANQSNFNSAITSYLKAVNLGEEDDEIYNYLGVAYYNIDDYENAADAFKKSVLADSTIAIRVLNLGKSYYNLNNYELAIPILEKAAKMDTTDADAFNHLGLSYYHNRDFQRSVSYFTKALEINAEGAVYLDNRASAKTELMDYTGAIEDYSQSIDLYSTDSEIYYQRGLLHILTSNAYSGCRDFKKAKELGHETVDEDIEKNCSFQKTGEE